MSQYIFNEVSSKTKIWRKPTATMLQSSKIVFELPAYKKVANKEGYVKRYFFIKENFLSYKRSEVASKPSGYMNLNWTSVEFNYHRGNKFGMFFEIAFIRNGGFTCVYLNKEKDMKMWINALSRICVQTDFLHKFEIVDYIDSGSFGKVIFFIYLFWFRSIFLKNKNENFFQKRFEIFF